MGAEDRMENYLCAWGIVEHAVWVPQLNVQPDPGLVRRGWDWWCGEEVDVKDMLRANDLWPVVRMDLEHGEVVIGNRDSGFQAGVRINALKCSRELLIGERKVSGSGIRYGITMKEEYIHPRCRPSEEGRHRLQRSRAS